MHVCMYVPTYVRMYVCMCVFIHVHLRTYKYIYIHIHTYTRTQKQLCAAYVCGSYIHRQMILIEKLVIVRMCALP